LGDIRRAPVPCVHGRSRRAADCRNAPERCTPEVNVACRNDPDYRGHRCKVVTAVGTTEPPTATGFAGARPDHGTAGITPRHRFTVWCIRIHRGRQCHRGTGPSRPPCHPGCRGGPDHRGHHATGYRADQPDRSRPLCPPSSVDSRNTAATSATTAVGVTAVTSVASAASTRVAHGLRPAVSRCWATARPTQSAVWTACPIVRERCATSKAAAAGTTALRRFGSREPSPERCGNRRCSPPNRDH